MKRANKTKPPAAAAAAEAGAAAVRFLFED